MQEAQVYVSTLATRGEIEGIRSAFGEVQAEANIEAIIPPQGFEIPWLVFVDLPVQEFLVGVAGGAGWAGLQAFFKTLKEAHEPRRRFWRRKRQPRQGQLVVRPPIEIPADLEPDHRAAVLMGWIGPKASETELAIPADLPDEGFRALFELDLDQYPNHYVHWNSEHGEWRAREKEPPQSLPKDSEESD
ncbi:MAG TPA: hypothetical protein VEW07_12220 [Solirubrobacterales bacterium]|nr:hypothetical protein [Solirubrobacterales bacterium]